VPSHNTTLVYHDAKPGRCCYASIKQFEPKPERPKHYRGRAARVDGAPRVASVAPGAHWSAVLAPAVAGLSPELRDRLADAWQRAARMEHASIASFSALSLRLLALGAPPDLVEDAHVAALDEIRHARLAFELASAYAGAPLAPVRFDDAARLPLEGDLAALAIETLLDGCINETVAAVEADAAGDAAADPAVAGALHEIARDEARHAELAWRIVAWCVRSGGDGLLAALRETAAAAGLGDAALGDAALEDAAPTGGDLGAHGVLGDAALAAARAGVLREIVAPCLDALSGRGTRSARRDPRCSSPGG
jgi:hypothetical protein